MEELDILVLTRKKGGGGAGSDHAKKIPKRAELGMGPKMFKNGLTQNGVSRIFTHLLNSQVGQDCRLGGGRRRGVKLIFAMPVFSLQPVELPFPKQLC